MGNVSYDRNVIQTFADRLYQRAIMLIIAYSIVGAVFGLFVGNYWAAVQLEDGVELADYWHWVITLIGLVVGALVGNHKAFTLRLEAQRLLVLAQIEHNTRK